MPEKLWLSARYVLEHLEKASTEHFDFAEHKHEHQILPEHRARAPSTLIIGYE